MITTLYLIRHGETEGAEVRRYKGSIDVPLSEKGVKQMEKINRSYMSHKANFSAVYCSDLGRAVKSAEIIASPHGIKPVVMPELRERNFGLWEGMSFDEIKEKYPDEFDAWANNPLKFSPMGGESTLEVRDRVIKRLDKIICSHNSNNMQDKKNHGSCIMNHDSNIAIVAHGGVNRIILCHFLEIPLENIFRVEQDYGAVNIIEIWDKYPIVKLINGQAALEDEHGKDRA